MLEKLPWQKKALEATGTVRTIITNIIIKKVDVIVKTPKQYIHD